ncbi:hypothetical protein PUR71_10120 [Streptomyces sp. SP17BM10]|uniref:hypothetical protein n=1 Tax=Streptomyces sp. SP17BM10 TaxID=3002530 RepID=UPI002E75D0A1|nr:hypothetical protein [Streptomyces sp. SP17BM10]MEE1783266.1 hypothetical protein [Streptomyces sp. SP17BM10]
MYDLERLRQAMVAVLPAGTDPDPGVPEEELVLSGQSTMFALVLVEHGQLIEDTSVVSACGWATGRLFDPGPSPPEWLDGFEELGEAFEVAVGELTSTPIAYTAWQPPAPGLPDQPASRPAPQPVIAAPETLAGARRWQQLLAEILGGAAVGAVGALFGEVAGAAVHGATEPLVRRVADWAAARVARRETADDSRSGGSDSTQPAATAPEPASNAANALPAGYHADAPAPRPVTLADLVALTAQIAELCGVQHHLDPRTIRVRSRLVHRPRDPKAKPTANQPFLHSLLPPDLARVRAALGDGRGESLGPALDAYLTAHHDIPTHTRTDLRQDRLTVLEGVRPSLVPAGRWPANPEHPLALSQQFAVNRMLADRDGTEGGLFSVNGSPGTGKTTMLRDLVAALVVERATVMASYKRPEEGFVGRPWRGKDRQGVRPRFVAALDPRLTGYEIVVTSSNNGAVENITAELPGATALHRRWHDGPDHFPDLASALLGGAPAWGLVAAVLGNKTNRKEFGERFWWGRLPEDETTARTDAGLPPLRGMNAILGDWIPPITPKPTRTPYNRRTSTSTGTSTSTSTSTANEATPPTGPAQPIPSWRQAVTAFKAAQAEVERLRTERTALANALADTASGRSQHLIDALHAAIQRAWLSGRPARPPRALRSRRGPRGSMGALLRPARPPRHGVRPGSDPAAVHVRRRPRAVHASPASAHTRHRRPFRDTRRNTPVGSFEGDGRPRTPRPARAR